MDSVDIPSRVKDSPRGHESGDAITLETGDSDLYMCYSLDKQQSFCVDVMYVNLLAPAFCKWETFVWV